MMECVMDRIAKCKKARDALHWLQTGRRPSRPKPHRKPSPALVQTAKSQKTAKNIILKAKGCEALARNYAVRGGTMQRANRCWTNTVAECP
jgi:hypothetical protein